MTATLDGLTASAWIDRWDAQQEVFMPDREERFTALIDAVAETAGREDPLVIDLGCGPGSLGYPQPPCSQSTPIRSCSGLVRPRGRPRRAPLAPCALSNSTCGYQAG